MTGMPSAWPTSGRGPSRVTGTGEPLRTRPIAKLDHAARVADQPCGATETEKTRDLVLGRRNLPSGPVSDLQQPARESRLRSVHRIARGKLAGCNSCHSRYLAATSRTNAQEHTSAAPGKTGRTGAPRVA